MLAHFLFMLRSNNVASSIIQNQAPMGAKYSKCHCYWIDLSRSNLLALIRRMKIHAFSKLCSGQTDREFIADFVFFSQQKQLISSLCSPYFCMSVSKVKNLTCTRGGRGGRPHVHFCSSSLKWKALSSINQICMHYTWLSVHPSTNTDMHMQEPKKLTKVIIYIYNTVVKCIYVRGLHLGLGLLHLIAFFFKKNMQSSPHAPWNFIW